jgi:hypothetical protein
MTPRRKVVSDRGSLAFNSLAYALSAVALFVIVLLIVGCEMAIAGLERAYTYFEAKEYSWLVPGQLEKRS